MVFEVGIGQNVIDQAVIEDMGEIDDVYVPDPVVFENLGVAAVGVNDADLQSSQPCFEDTEDDATSDFSSLLDVLAMQHLISNTSEGFASAMPCYTTVIDGGY